MSQETLPTAGRVSLAQKVVSSSFLFALSRGNPAWDSQWGSPNTPAPPISATDVLDLIGYARPTIVGFLQEDAGGDIVAANSEKFSVSATPTRWARIRLSLPVGTFVGQTLREIGLFIDPVIAGSVPAGQTIIAPADVQSKGRLFNLHWREPLPIEDGSHFARNFVVKL